MNKDLLNMITCPVCKEKTGFIPDKNALECKKCNILFPVEDGVPMMQLSKSRSFDKA
jgi:uncharacterized protein YbaR (Trm112 family)